MENKAIKITPIKQHQIDEAKQIVITVCLEIWDELLTEDDLKIQGLTAEGRTTAKLLQLNTDDRIAERQRFWE